MAAEKHDGPLAAVYGATNPAEVARAYDGWADSYEADMRASGYRHPAICLALLARHVPKGAGPVLDAGAGTGLIGEWLGLIGYPQAEALDLSEGMLNVAKAKGVYAALHRAALGGPLPFDTGRFAAVVSAGVFTTGHVGAEALPELIRVTKPGGPIVMTVKQSLWESGFQAALVKLAQNGSIAIAEKTAPYLSMPGDPATTPSLCVVVKVAPYALGNRFSGS
ncbi:MAG: class I SAM-dependent DNA methyltransferase [Paracoccaceae bacterium]